MVSIELFLGLLVAAVVVVIVSARLRIPYTVGLVVLGLVLGVIADRAGFSRLPTSVSAFLSPNLFFDILLPPIIFEAALHVNVGLLRRRAGLILFLVVVGVVFTTLFAGLVVAVVAGLPLLAAFLLASILSPTDPVSVVDLFRRLKVPEELATIIEGESIFNDAVAVMLFVVLVGVAESATFRPIAATLQFAWLTVGGIAIGLLAAGGVYLLHRRLNDAAVETTLSVVAAYGSFLLATDVGASGIIATAIAGLAVGSVVAPRAMDARVRDAIGVFWNVVVYVANSVIFLAMGLLLAVSNLEGELPLIVVVFLALVGGRAIFVWTYHFVGRMGTPTLLPPTWSNVITLSGVRGAIPIVLALSLLSTQTDLPSSTIDTIVAAVFGVAFVSIVVGNLTTGWYVRRHFPEESAEGPGGAAS